MLDLTVTIDHKGVEGAPGARFGAELRLLLSPQLCAPAAARPPPSEQIPEDP